jgi:hypothetical protein
MQRTGFTEEQITYALRHLEAAAQLRHRRAGLGLLQNRNDLTVGNRDFFKGISSVKVNSTSDLI